MTDFSEEPTFARLMLRSFVFPLLTLSLLVAVFYLIENMRGRNAWNNTKAEIEAKGQSLSWKDHIPQPIPDADNMLKDAQVEDWFVHGKDANSWLDLEKLAKDLANLQNNPLAVGNLTLTEPKADQNSSLAEALAEAVKSNAAPWTEVSQMRELVINGPRLTHLARLRHDQLPQLQLSVPASTSTSAEDATKALASALGPYKVEARATAAPGRFDLFLVKSTVFSCADLLALTDALQPRFESLLNAARRPGAYLAGDYSSPLKAPVPKFNPIRYAGRCLALRLQGHLWSGQPGKAVEDLAALNTVRKTIANTELTLVVSMMDTVLQGLIFDALQTGFTRHAWRTEDLAVLEAHSQSSKPAATVFKSLHSERLWSVWLMEAYDGNTRAMGSNLISVMGMGPSLSNDALWAVIPSGWVRQNVASVVRPMSAVIDSYDTARDTLSMDKFALSQKLITAEVNSSGPYHFLSKILLPSFDRITTQTVRTQTQVSLTVLACALERHRLATGAFPEKLESLVPKYLAKAPHQTVNGEPFLYRLEPDGGYSLWSIGWDLKDDGGSFAVGDKVEEAKADWGWRMTKP